MTSCVALSTRRGVPCAAADLQNYLHAPQPTSVASGLLGAWAPLGSHTSSRFAWLSAAGLQHGKLRTDLEQRPSSDLEYLAMESDIITLDDSRGPIKCMVRVMMSSAYINTLASGLSS